MRLSPVWGALLAASALLSFSQPGQTQSLGEGGRRTETPVAAGNADADPAIAPEPATSARSVDWAAISREWQAIEATQNAPGESHLPPSASPRLQAQVSDPPVPDDPGESPTNAPSAAEEADGEPEGIPPEAETETEMPDATEDGTESPEVIRDTEDEPTPSRPQAPLPIPRDEPETQPEGSQTSEPEVLVAEVVVEGVEGEPELEDEVYRAISLRPGRTTTRSQLQEDINAIFATGYFSNVRARPEDTPLGVRVTFVVEPNPVLQAVEIRGNQVLPQTVIDEIFGEQYGEILNLRRFQNGIKELNEWYQANGYVLAQVIDAPQVTPEGTAILEVAEGVVEDIQIRFINEDGETVDEEGQPIKGRTREYIITRELELEPGEVFNRAQVERDLQRVFGLGIFEDVQISLNPGENPRNVVVVINVLEKNTGSIAAGAGISSASGLFGTVSYQEQNLLGRNLKLGAELQVGQRELLFDVNFTDPWIAGDENRTSYTVNAFRRRSISLIFDGGDNDVELDNGDRPRVLRLGGGVTFSRPLENDWRASLGAKYQRVSIRDSDGDIEPEDELGNDLSFSGDGEDDLLTVQLAASRDRRNNRAQPTAGSLFRVSAEQSVPIGLGNIFMTQLRSSYSYYVPLDIVKFSDGAETLALSVQGGTTIGDLPPYEAFSLGGSTTVRGYGEGELGTGRSFVQATAEYRFPIYAIVGGALFFDAATDLGTGGDVPGDPAGVRDKPGSGFGYGVGVRVQSPLGPIRVDYAFNDEGESRFHFGIGERF
ncbi:BamA/TamA family outer membrane protein [Oxynema sp. CENA135]|uniref:BamA/TamA family outer membrane protein n=1 Tax=Oxynema sp. CENA135 TaxID=984206 RepID=UPI001909829E|nr:BamA/TamA family outer membrane protein [Oxynema sp. CENA135]MBK4731171.1 BamA/TamA family outer membrane protein [Oxynema sp. CENA135]